MEQGYASPIYRLNPSPTRVCDGIHVYVPRRYRPDGVRATIKIHLRPDCSRCDNGPRQRDDDEPVRPHCFVVGGETIALISAAAGWCQECMPYTDHLKFSQVLVDIRDGDVPTMDLRNTPIGQQVVPEGNIDARRLFGNIPSTWMRRGGPSLRLDDVCDGDAEKGWRTDPDATENMACRRSNGDHSFLTLLGRFARKVSKFRIKIWKNSAIGKERNGRPDRGFIDRRFDDVQFLYEETGEWCREFY